MPENSPQENGSKDSWINYFLLFLQEIINKLPEKKVKEIEHVPIFSMKGVMVITEEVSSAFNEGSSLRAVKLKGKKSENIVPIGDDTPLRVITLNSIDTQWDEIIVNMEFYMPYEHLPGSEYYVNITFYVSGIDIQKAQSKKFVNIEKEDEFIVKIVLEVTGNNLDRL